jgi:hypothetical protein
MASITHIYTGPFTLKNWWLLKIRANSEPNGLYSLNVAGVSFEKSAFEVSDFPHKSSRRHVDCDVLAWNRNFQNPISCHVFDQILKIRPFLNSENFKFSECLNIWPENKMKLAIYFCQLYFANCAKLTPAANTKTHQWLFKTHYYHFLSILEKW